MSPERAIASPAYLASSNASIGTNRKWFAPFLPDERSAGCIRREPARAPHARVEDKGVGFTANAKTNSTLAIIAWNIKRRTSMKLYRLSPTLSLPF
jgi:hypothetical protein